jgi:hypothetical protein
MSRQTMFVGAALALALATSGCSGGDPAPGGDNVSSSATGGGSTVNAAVLAQSGDASSFPSAPGITVVGTGRITGEPDTLTTTVGVEVERESVDAALDGANEAMQRVIDAARAAGIDEDDIQTREFSVNPRYDHRPNGGPVLRGYQLTNLVDLKIRDLEGAGDVLAATTAAAAMTRVSAGSGSHSRTSRHSSTRLESGPSRTPGPAPSSTHNWPGGTSAAW